MIFRQIFTDGRPLPQDPEPAWLGYSIGRWDGDTFVVDTIGLRAARAAEHATPAVATFQRPRTAKMPQGASGR
jgi:hypothetical protein